MARVVWSNDRQVRNNMQAYTRAVSHAVEQLAIYYAAVIEASAKQKAPWVDRTGNARAALRGYTNRTAPAGYPNPDALARDTIALYLSHGMDYGKWLELKYQGRYAIILPTLQAHYGEISQALRRMFAR